MGGKKAVLSFGEDNCISDIFKKDFLRSLSLGKYNPNNKYLFIHSADVTYYNLTDPEGVLIRSDKLIHDNRRRSPREALKHAYIQPNSKYNLSNIIIDIDREDFSISDFVNGEDNSQSLEATPVIPVPANPSKTISPG